MKPPNLPRLILDQVQMEMEDEWTAPREMNTFRSSEAGDCPRALLYAVRGKKKEGISPELAMLFRDGDLHHNALRDQLKRVGRLTNVEYPARKTYKVPLTDGPMDITLTGTVDCVFNGDYIVDIKSINRFSFQALSKPYIAAQKRKYVYQIQFYMDILDKEWGCLLFKNKDTSALKEFWYKRNPKMLAQALIKLAKITRANHRGVMIKRPFKKSSWECKSCPMRIHCWKTPMKRREWK